MYSEPREADRDGRLFARLQLGAALDHDRLDRAAAGDRQRVDHAGALRRRAARARARAACRRSARICAGLRVARVGQADVHLQHAARIEAGVDVAQRVQAAQHHAGAHQQHQRQRDLGDDQRRGASAMPAPAESLRPPSFSVSFRSVRPARSAGIDAGQETGQHRRAEDEQQHPAIHRRLLGARHLVREQRRARRRSPTRASSSPAAPPASASTIDSTIRCWNTRRRPGAERGADRELLAAAHRARQDQVADVGARDQQHQRHGAEQHQQRGPHVADDQLMQRDRRAAPARRSRPGMPLRAASRSPRAPTSPAAR